MKKIIAIVSYCLLILGVIVFISCLCVMPEQTKLFLEGVKDFFNRPLPIAIGASATIGGVLFLIARYIISKTKFGNKQLSDMTNQINNLRNEQNKFIESVNENKEEVKELYFDIKEKEEIASSCVENFNARIDELYLDVINVCEKIPNAKVKNSVLELKNKYNSSRQDLSDKIMMIKSGTEIMKNGVNLSELMNKIDELQNEVRKYAEGKEESND